MAAGDLGGFDAVEKGCVSRGGMMREGEPMGIRISG